MASDIRRSPRLGLLLGASLGAAVAVALVVVWAGGGNAVVIPGIPDAGGLTAWGRPVARTVADATATRPPARRRRLPSRAASRTCTKSCFLNQSQWGEAKEAKDDVFRGYAQELGLDMATYDTDVVSAQTIARITADQRDAMGLKVQGTPTFFLDGEKVATPKTYEAFKALIEQRLAKR